MGFAISCYSLETEASKRWDIQEADVVEFLVDLGKSIFGYGLRNGTIGAYHNTTRLWRVKSKHKLHSLVAMDAYADGQLKLISGWSNGKVGAVERQKFDEAVEGGGEEGVDW